MGSRAVLLLLAFAIGLATTWWFATQSGDRRVDLASPASARHDLQSPPPVGGPVVSEALELHAVLASLQRIEERLERLEARADNDAAGSDRQALTTGYEQPSRELTDVVAKLANLERTLTEEVAQRRRASSETNLAQLKAEHPEEKWAALDDFMAHWSRDEKEASDDLRLLSYRDVLTRFGSPTEMWSNERGTHWTYGQGHDAVDGGYQREVYVRFEDGLVTTLGVK